MDEVIKQLLEQYNSRAEKTGLKKFVIATTYHHAHNISGDEEYFTTLIHREVSQWDSTHLPIIIIDHDLFLQPEKPPPPRTVINRAIEEGIIDGSGISDGETVVKKKCKVKKRRPKYTIPAMTIAAQQKIVQKKEPKNEPKGFRF